jgi:hypothetical protein
MDQIPQSEFEQYLVSSQIDKVAQSGLAVQRSRSRLCLITVRASFDETLTGRGGFGEYDSQRRFWLREACQ